jgi:hypothetical protein
VKKVAYERKIGESALFNEEEGEELSAEGRFLAGVYEETGCWDACSHASQHVSCAIELFDALTGETAAFQECEMRRGDNGVTGEDTVLTGVWTNDIDAYRYPFFEVALGRDPDPTLEEAMAENYGDERRYYVRITRLDTGAVVLDEISELIRSGN